MTATATGADPMEAKQWMPWCPHAKTAETLCFIRHGEAALVPNKFNGRIQMCSGCDRSQDLLAVEKRKLRRGGDKC